MLSTYAGFYLNSFGIVQVGTINHFTLPSFALLIHQLHWYYVSLL